MSNTSFSRELTFEPAHYSLWWPIAGLLAMLTIVFYPYLFEEKILLPTDMFDTMTAPFNAEYGPPQAQNHYFWDGIVQTLPYKTETQKALLEHRISHWNPRILGGYPQYAETLGNNFDLFNFLLIWLPPMTVIHLEFMLELFIAGVGMMLLLRFFGVRPLLSLLFGSSYMLNSMFVSTAAVRWAAASFCWVPFVVLMLLQFFRTDRWPYLFFTSSFLALSFLAGNLQSSFFAAAVAATVTLTYPSVLSKWNRVMVLSIVGIISFALSALMWFPTLELFFQTLFYGGSLNSSNVYGNYTIIQRLLTLPFLSMFAFPEMFGGPQIFSIKSIAGLDITNFQGAIGFLPTLFGIWGCFKLWRNKNIQPFIILVLSGMLLPITTPLYSVVYHRFFLVSSFSLSVVGAIWFQHFQTLERSSPSIRKMLRTSMLLWGLLTFFMVGVGVYIRLEYPTVLGMFSKYISASVPTSAFGVGNESWIFDRVRLTLLSYSFGDVRIWIGLFTAGSVLSILAFYHSGSIPKRVMLVGVFILTAVQLLSFARLWLPAVNPKTSPIYPANPILTFLQHGGSLTRYATWRDGRHDPYLLPSNSSDIYHINDFSGYESLTCRSMSVFYEQHVPEDSIDLRLLGLASVRFIVTRSHQIQSPDAHPVFAANGLTVYENARCRPRAYLSYQVKVLNSDSDISTEMLRENYDGSTTLFPKSDAPDVTGIAPNANDSIYLVRFQDEEVQMKIHTRSKTLLILTDTYYPGWKCYVNGHEERIYRVNGCMRGVVIGPGNSAVDFRFEPDTFRAGFGLSAATLFISAFAIFLLRKKPWILKVAESNNT